MKKLFVFLFFVGLLFVSCEKNTVETDESLTKNASISTSEAFDIFKSYIELVTDQPFTSEFTSLYEITTDEIFQKTGMLIFKVTSDIPALSNNCFVIKSNKDSYLLESFYGRTPTISDYDHMIVADILNNNKYQIIFLSGFEGGSWFGIEALDTDPENQGVGGAAFVIDNQARNYVRLEKVDDQNVQVRYKDEKYDVIIGKVGLDTHNGDSYNSLTIIPNLDIPQEVKDKLGANWFTPFP